MENAPSASVKARSFKPLLILTIVSLVIICGGLLCSYLFWKDHVNGQFGLAMPFTFLIFVLMNTAFKIPGIVDAVLLSVFRHKVTGKTRKISGILAAVVIISIIAGVAAEFAMFLATRGSSLG